MNTGLTGITLIKIKRIKVKVSGVKAARIKLIKTILINTNVSVSKTPGIILIFNSLPDT